jgi:hypothetical protein
VLLDYAAWAAKHNIKVDVFTKYGIPVSHLKQLVEEENIVFHSGDILFIRSGFVETYDNLSTIEEANLPQRKDATFIGVESTVEMARWFWENEFAAVAGDMPGFEASPIWDSDLQLHQWLLAGWGMPLGEMFYLEDLAHECKRLGRNTFFVTSVPLKVCLFAFHYKMFGTCTDDNRLLVAWQAPRMRSRYYRRRHDSASTVLDVDTILTPVPLRSINTQRAGYHGSYLGGGKARLGTVVEGNGVAIAITGYMNFI